jgi:hypothetical protein
MEVEVNMVLALIDLTATTGFMSGNNVLDLLVRYNSLFISALGLVNLGCWLLHPHEMIELIFFIFYFMLSAIHQALYQSFHAITRSTAIKNLHWFA